MSSTENIILQNPNEDDERFFDHSHRQAALRELEEQFHLQLTERDVFRAASLFFALLADGAFVNKGFIIHEVQRQILNDTDLALGVKKDPA
jgi:hypothetical protein